MSYRDPQQTLNKSAGALYASTAQSIASGVQAISSAYKTDQAAIKKNQDEIKQMIEKANNQKILFDTTLNQAYDTGVWFDADNKDKLSREANDVSLLMQKSIKTPEETQRISNFMGSASVTKKDFEAFGTLLSNLETDMTIYGEGGVSDSQYPNRLKRAQAFAGLSNGKISIDTDLSKPGGPNNKYTWTSDDGKTTYEIDSSELRNIQDKPGVGIYNITPKYTETFTEIGKEAITALGKNSNFNQPVTEEKRDTEGNLIQTDYIQKFNKKGFLNAVKPKMIGLAGAYSNRPQDFVTMYNHMISQNPEKYGEKAENVQRLSPAIDINQLNEAKPKLIEMMSYNALKLQGDQDVIMKTTTPSKPSTSDDDKLLNTIGRVEEIFDPIMKNINGRNAEYFNMQKYGKGQISEASFLPREWDSEDNKWIDKEIKPGGTDLTKLEPFRAPTPVLTFTLNETSGGNEIVTPITIDVTDKKAIKVFLEDATRGKYGEDAITDETFAFFTKLLNKPAEKKEKKPTKIDFNPKIDKTAEEMYNNYLNNNS